MLSPFPIPPPQTPYSTLLPFAAKSVLPHPPTHSYLTPLASPFSGVSSLHRTKHIPLMPGESVLCYICIRDHRLAFVCPLVGSLVPGSSERSS